MIKREIDRKIIGLLKRSVQAVWWVTILFTVCFSCWFIYHLLRQLKDLCENTIFFRPWY